MAEIESIDDARTDNTMRHKYRVLTDVEKMLMDEIKDRGELLLESIKALGAKEGVGRECAIARTKTEEAVMWAVKGLTK